LRFQTFCGACLELAGAVGLGLGARSSGSLFDLPVFRATEKKQGRPCFPNYLYWSNFRSFAVKFRLLGAGGCRCNLPVYSGCQGALAISRFKCGYHGTLIRVRFSGSSVTFDLQTGQAEQILFWWEKTCDEFTECWRRYFLTKTFGYCVIMVASRD
jgi:hypothetical protein